MLVGAMGIPVGGRHPLSSRFKRHFNMISFPEMSPESLERIYTTILDNWLTSFDESIQSLTVPVVQAAIAMYDRIRRVLRPSPSRSHYTYNLRDLSKVFQVREISSCALLVPFVCVCV